MWDNVYFAIKGKNSAETILPFFLPLMEKLTLPLNELESFSNSNNLN